jgi:hypothetical protein
MLGEVWTTQMPPVYVLQSVTASAWRGHMSAPRRRAHVRRCSQRTAWLSQPPARARRRGPAQCHPVEIVWAHSQPGWLRAGMERMSRTPSVSGNERAGAEGVPGGSGCGARSRQGFVRRVDRRAVGRGTLRDRSAASAVAGTWAGLDCSRSATGLTCAGVYTYWVGSIFAHHATCAIPEHAVRTLRVAWVRKRT